jgi:hypothetical protein
MHSYIFLSSDGKEFLCRPAIFLSSIFLSKFSSHNGLPASDLRQLLLPSYNQYARESKKSAVPIGIAGWPWAVARPGLPQIRTWTH